MGGLFGTYTVGEGGEDEDVGADVGGTYDVVDGCTVVTTVVG